MVDQEEHLADLISLYLHYLTANIEKQPNQQQEINQITENKIRAKPAAKDKRLKGDYFLVKGSCTWITCQTTSQAPKKEEWKHAKRA